MTDTLERPTTTPVVLDAKIPDGPLTEKWQNFIANSKLVNPNNKRKFKIIVVGTGLAGASAAATLAELGYQVEAFTFHDSARRGPLDRRPGRDQRRQELPRRRRQHLPPLLRHDQGRRLPRPRGERLSTRPSLGEHHRSGCRAGRPVRSRVRRPPRQPQLRWRPGQPHVLRRRADRSAAAARRLPADVPPGRARATSSCGRARSSSTSSSSTGAAQGSSHATPDRGDPLPQRPRSDPGYRRLRQRVLPVHQRDGLQRHGGVAGPSARRAVRQPVLHTDPSDVHPTVRRVPVEAHADVGVAAQRRPGLGAQGGR